MYKHLSREERYQIQSLVRAQHTTAEIARLLVQHPSTIGREIKHDRKLKGYRAEKASSPQVLGLDFFAFLNTQVSLIGKHIGFFAVQQNMGLGDVVGIGLSDGHAVNQT